MVCGKSTDQIMQEKINWYMQRSTPDSEPAYITALRREAYSNGLNADSLLFLTPAVSQAADDGDGGRTGNSCRHPTHLLEKSNRNLNFYIPLFYTLCLLELFVLF